MRIDTVFIAGFLIVNLQWPLMVVLTDSAFAAGGIFNLVMKYTNFGVWLSTVSITSWAIGHASPAPRIGVRIDRVTGMPWLLLACYVTMFVFAAVAGRDYLSGAIYKEAREGVAYGTVPGAAAYVYTLLGIALATAVVTTAYLSFWRRRGGPLLAAISPMPSYWQHVAAVTLIASTIFILAGERGIVLQLFFAAVIPIASSRRPIGVLFFLACGALVALALSYVGYARAEGWVEALRYFADLGAWDVTANLAGSAVTVYYGIDLLVNKGDLFYGQLWISNLIGLVPFGQGALSALFDIPIQRFSGANVITEYVYGENAPSGLGTSLVIDVFMNIGTVGLILAMTVYGAICRVMQGWLSGKNGFLRFLVAGTFASLVFYTARSSLWSQLVPVVWGLGLALVVFRVRRRG